MKIFKMTMVDFNEAREEYGGRCVKCGAEAFQIEPDAREYECEACGKRAVYGIEELLQMGCVQIREAKP